MFSNNIGHSKDSNGNAYIHMRGLGAFQVPEGIQQGLNEATDEWLVDNVKRGAHVDPFVLAEITNRGIYWKVAEKEQASRPSFDIKRFLGITDQESK